MTIEMATSSTFDKLILPLAMKDEIAPSVLSIITY